MNIRDQIGHDVVLNSTPTRIISLVPSQSELLHYLGCEKSMIGITRFCTHPKELRKNVKIVGGTKDLDFESIKLLKPDLIICNKEENNKKDVLKLQKLYPTYTSDVNNLTEALNMISDIGELTSTKKQSEKLVTQIDEDFKKILNFFSGTVAYLIWNDPIMLAGQNTFINSNLKFLGFKNIVLETKSRYPEILESDLNNETIDYIFLSSEPYPFKEKNKKLFQNKFPQAKVVLVDGRVFSWYGSCLIEVSDYVKTLTKQLS